MNRARVGIAGLVVIMLGLLLAATVNVAHIYLASADQPHAESALVMLGYEPGQAFSVTPSVPRPVLVDCPERPEPRPATV